MSTVDPKSSVSDVIIEERNPDEVRKIKEVWISTPTIPVLNMAFDMTPPDLVTGIITEKGIARAPYQNSLERMRS
jgi:methylthioribose-1-phosphate isomerase